MSWPVETYSCTSCNWRAIGGAGVGIYRYRAPDGGYFAMWRQMAWCSNCNTLTRCEVLPDYPSAVVKLRAAYDELAKSIASARKRPWSWLTKQTRKSQMDAEEDVTEAIRRLEFISIRKSPPRCLTCFRTEITPIQYPKGPAGSDQVQLEFTHPGCGGKLMRNWGKAGGTRVGTNLYDYEFDIEGMSAGHTLSHLPKPKHWDH